MALLLVVVMLIIIYFVNQNNKIQILFDGLYKIDHEIEDKLKQYVSHDGFIDVFTLQDIRTMMIRDYIHKHLLDDFRVYKTSMYKLKIILKSGLAVQSLEVVTNKPEMKLVEMPLRSEDLEVFKV
ncbi:MAG: hypothetical protein JXR88_06600 [Clostridia bacterium]|nr:hypothetical protein [Clostridia bacterium]